MYVYNTQNFIFYLYYKKTNKQTKNKTLIMTFLVNKYN